MQLYVHRTDWDLKIAKLLSQYNILTAEQNYGTGTNLLEYSAMHNWYTADLHNVHPAEHVYEVLLSLLILIYKAPKKTPANLKTKTT